MNLVLDTHPLVWYVAGHTQRLSAKARRAFEAAESARSTLHVPSIVLMEIAMLEHIGKIRGSYASFRERLAARPGFRVEPFTEEDVDESRALSFLHDPFDRMIAGTASRLRLPLLTRDTVLRAARGVRTVW